MTNGRMKSHVLSWAFAWLKRIACKHIPIPLGRTTSYRRRRSNEEKSRVGDRRACLHKEGTSGKHAICSVHKSTHAVHAPQFMRRPQALFASTRSCRLGDSKCREVTEGAFGKHTKNPQTSRREVVPHSYENDVG